MPPPKPFNIYGDRFIPTTGFHGTNISQQRVDKLDMACLSFIEDRLSTGAPLHAIDLGGGAGAQSKRMARLGAHVILIDLSATPAEIEAFNLGEKTGKITLLNKDVGSSIVKRTEFIHISAQNFIKHRCTKPATN